MIDARAARAETWRPIDDRRERRRRGVGPLRGHSCFRDVGGFDAPLLLGDGRHRPAGGAPPAGFAAAASLDSRAVGSVSNRVSRGYWYRTQPAASAYRIVRWQLAQSR